MIKKIYMLLLTVLGMGAISSCSDYLNSEKYFKDRSSDTGENFRKQGSCGRMVSLCFLIYKK